MQTPHIDRLASEGTTFKNAFVTCPVCSPSRSAIITSRYQTAIGAHNHRSQREVPLPENVALITEHFREAGYFTCNSPGPGLYDRVGKTDFNFARDRPFDGTDWSQRAPGQPFYAQLNIMDTHRDFVRDPDSPIDPSTVDLPPYYPDHPLARADWAHYLESIQECWTAKSALFFSDSRTKTIARNTIVFFISDHGRAHTCGTSNSCTMAACACPVSCAGRARSIPTPSVNGSYLGLTLPPVRSTCAILHPSRV